MKNENMSSTTGTDRTSRESVDAKAGSTERSKENAYGVCGIFGCWYVTGPAKEEIPSGGCDNRPVEG